MLRIEGKRKTFARTLRRNSTLEERLLWSQLRGHRLLGLQFRRQEPMGPYIVDFVCHQAKLVVEADGSQHCDNPQDTERTVWLEQHGYRVLRFWNNEIKSNMEGVIETIRDVVQNGQVPCTPTLSLPR